MRIGVSTAGSVPASLEKIACGDFFATVPLRPPAKSVVFAGWGAA
jgi:hypothetical protein